MTFLALIISLGLLQYWGSAGPLHKDDWFRDFSNRVMGVGLIPELQIAVAVLLPAILVYLVEDLVTGWFFGLVSLALLVVVLLYSFGRRDFDDLVKRYRGFTENSDFEGAYLFATSELDGETEEDCPNGPEQLHRWVKERLCYLGFERWFAVIFYFALLGAPGALAYRLLHLYGQHTEDVVQKRMVSQLLYYLNWIPARMLVFAFALTGDWVGSRAQVVSSFSDTDTPTSAVLAVAAHAALGLKATVFSGDNGDDTAFAEISTWEIGELQSLLSRSAVAWVVVLSLLVLFL